MGMKVKIQRKQWEKPLQNREAAESLPVLSTGKAMRRALRVR